VRQTQGLFQKKSVLSPDNGFFPQRVVGKTISFAEGDSIYSGESGKSKSAAVCGGERIFFCNSPNADIGLQIEVIQ